MGPDSRVGYTPVGPTGEPTWVPTIELIRFHALVEEDKKLRALERRRQVRKRCRRRRGSRRDRRGY